MILAGGLLNFHLNKLEVMRLHLFMSCCYLKTAGRILVSSSTNSADQTLIPHTALISNEVFFSI